MGTLINDRDQCFFDHIASEVNRLAGTEAILYQFEEFNASIDPLYSEIREPSYKPSSDGSFGIRIPLFFQNPDKLQVNSEEGFQTEKTSIVFIAKSDLVSRNLRVPGPGDILKMWDLYWDVKTSHKEGVLNDNPTTSLYRIDVARRTKDAPESVKMHEQLEHEYAGE